ncbi:hypothetical protein HYV70_00845 [Candidatus Uhrbacteria bacterium]|nr:hypothetical protein [Candidatus Uhrbacteria bacterium]
MKGFFAQKNLIEPLVRTGFLTSLLFYILFWFTDFLIPGFVSRYFSVHLFLLTALVCGLLWSHVIDTYRQHPQWRRFIVFSLGFMFALLTWKFTSGLGFERFFLVMVVFFTPTLLSFFLNE